MRIITFLLLLTITAISTAKDLDTIKKKVAVCEACHGDNGVSVHGDYPNLAGQHAQYLTVALKSYRDGKRKDPMMFPMAFDLTDSDIEKIAAYYSKLGGIK